MQWLVVALRVLALVRPLVVPVATAALGAAATVGAVDPQTVAEVQHKLSELFSNSPE